LKIEEKIFLWIFVICWQQKVYRKFGKYNYISAITFNFDEIRYIKLYVITSISYFFV
jgi:hypothetical protein